MSVYSHTEITLEDNPMNCYNTFHGFLTELLEIKSWTCIYFHVHISHSFIFF